MKLAVTSLTWVSVGNTVASSTCDFNSRAKIKAYIIIILACSLINIASVKCVTVSRGVGV